MKLSLKETFLNEEKEKKSLHLEDYALLVDPGRHSSTFILYKPAYYADKIKMEVEKARKKFNQIRFKPDHYSFDDFYAFSNVQDVFSDPKGVVGYMEINNGRILGIRGTCNNANEIRVIASRDGFGKAMFMIALAKESPIMPNRENVTDHEKEYWKYLSGEHNIEKDSFDNEDGMHKKTGADCEVHGDNILDRSYKTPYDMSIQLQPLTNRHKMFLNQMKTYFKKNGVDYIQTRIKEYIADAGYIFHAEKRGEPGWYQNDEYDYE